MSEKHIHPGFTAITPYLYGEIGLNDFLKRAFGAVITHEPEVDAEGRFHAEAKIGDALLMFGNGYFADRSMAAAVYLYVADADATLRRARELGATAVREPADMTWGDRVGGVKDRWGNTWWIATHRDAR